jgi:hypothetical protein
MKCNVGREEQQVRIGVAGVTAAAAAFVPMPKWAKIGLFLTAAVELTTALTQYCPLSEAMGRDTCNR